MYKKLLDAAAEARENAYCEYSGFAVGAAREFYSSTKKYSS
jgi:cytidine deaminase